ncbi:MAG TPA: hypothetical protein VG841_09950 [Caulobacterales bacterium]|nr:hypothetical protein [Caulobacterales bacterium]
MDKLKALLCAAFALVATNARADDTGRWQRAESPHFIVYGDVGEFKLREAVRTLEMFDAELRHLLTAAPPPSANKLEVFLFRNQSRLRQVWPSAGSAVLGFYTANRDLIAAFATYGENAALEGQEVLFHEYAHHFMLQSTTVPYPAWYVEGFAEYVQTIRFESQRAVIGDFSRGRAQDILSSEWPPIEEFLNPDRSRWTTLREVRFYAESWVATHYLMDEPARMAQFQAYLAAINHGQDPVRAFEPNFGATPRDFERALHQYARGAIPRRASSLPNVDLSSLQVTPLPRSADDLLLLDARMRRGVETDDRADVARRVEEIAARYPDDAFAQRARARALLLRGAYPEARTLLATLTAADPRDIDALFLLGMSYIYEAMPMPRTDAAARTARAAFAAQGRRYFARAFRLNARHVPTLYAYATTYMMADGPIPDDALDVLLRAYDLAPQVSEIGLNTARNLMEHDRFDEATAILRPIAFSPHGQGASATARAMLDAAEKHVVPRGEELDRNDDSGG